jgi:hypothetical protein
MKTFRVFAQQFHNNPNSLPSFNARLWETKKRMRRSCFVLLRAFGHNVPIDESRDVTATVEGDPLFLWREMLSVEEADCIVAGKSQLCFFVISHRRRFQHGEVLAHCHRAWLPPGCGRWRVGGAGGSLKSAHRFRLIVSTFLAEPGEPGDRGEDSALGLSIERDRSAFRPVEPFRASPDRGSDLAARLSSAWRRLFSIALTARSLPQTPVAFPARRYAPAAPGHAACSSCSFQKHAAW